MLQRAVDDVHAARDMVQKREANPHQRSNLDFLLNVVNGERILPGSSLWY